MHKNRSKIFIFIVLIVLISILTTTAFAQSEISGKYSGTYTTNQIFIDKINEAVHKQYDYISYTIEDEDYESYSATMNIKNGQSAIMNVEGFVINSESVNVDSDNIEIVFQEGYYGYTDELKVKYVFQGTIDEDNINGNFTGYIVSTNEVETKGNIDMKAGGTINFDSLIDGLKNGEENNVEEEEEYFPVTDLLFKSVYEEVTVGYSGKLKATIFPKEATNKKVSYTSSNPSVIRVSQVGKVYAQSSGEASVTVWSDDNNNIYDVKEFIVNPDIEDLNEEEKAKVKAGMTLFEDDEDEKSFEEESFSELDESSLSTQAQSRVEEVKEELTKITSNDPEIEVEINDENKSINIVKTDEIEKVTAKEYEDTNEFREDVSSSKKIVKKPAKSIVNMIIDKLPKPAGIDVFHEYVKEKSGEYIDSQTSTTKKTKTEIKDQLQKTFSSDNEHFVLKYLKDKAESNSFVKLFAYPINKIFASKQEHYKEAVYTEYKSVKDSIQRKIDAGIPKDKAIERAKKDFVYNDNYDTTFDAIENAKPGLQRFYAMRQGGKENQVVTGAKKEYQSNDARFDKYIELFNGNGEFMEVQQ